MPISAEGKQQVLRTVMKATGEGVLVWTMPEGLLSDCNEAAARILGMPRDELAGRSLDYNWRLTREDGSPLPQSERGAVNAVRTGQSQPTMLLRVGRPDGSWASVRSSSIVLRDAAEVPYAVVTTFVDLTELRGALEENARLVAELQQALASVRTLEGLLPICMHCKAIRDDVGAWSSVEAYVSKRTEAAFSHGICPPCFDKHYGS